MRIDSITKYQDLACSTFKEHKGLTPREAELLDWSLGLPGEAGEVCELIKHHIFHGEPLDRIKLAKELGDVVWYISAISETTGISMKDILGLNIGKLQHRYNNQGYDQRASADRHKQEERFEDTSLFKIITDNIMEAETIMDEEHSGNIIFIGNECTGKSTVSGMLEHKLGMALYKGTFAEPNKLDLAFDAIYNAENVIFDRLYFPDELVYRKVKKNPLTSFESREYWKLLPIMKQRNFIVIYTTTQIDILIKRLVARGDAYIHKHEIPSISRIYESEILPEFTKVGIPVLWLDTSIATPSENLEEVLQFLRHNNHPLTRKK